MLTWMTMYKVNLYIYFLCSFVFQIADQMKTMVKRQGGNDLLRGKVLANAFFEPSTRTSCSFQAAMLRLGGTVVCVNEVACVAETINEKIG